MKVKNIEKICKSGKEIIRLDVEKSEKVERVFLGTDYAKFAIEPKLWLNPESFLDFFGIYGKETDKWYTEWEVAEGEESNLFSDEYPGEEECLPLGMKITYEDIEWQIFKTTNKGKLFFIPAEWLSAVDTKDDMVRFFLRSRGGYLAVKNGLILDGLITRPVAELNTRLNAMIDCLIKIGVLCEKRMEGAGADG